MSPASKAEPAGLPIVRRATGDDLTAVIDIGRRTWQAIYGPIAGEEYVQMGLAKWWTQEATIPAVRSGRVLVAELGETIVGMSSIGLDEHKLWLWKLYVLPEHHGRGAGSALLAAVLDRARADGHTEVFSSYVDGNEQAAGFYDRHGFVVDHRDEGGSGIPDSIVVRCALTGKDQN